MPLPMPVQAEPMQQFRLSMQRPTSPSSTEVLPGLVQATRKALLRPGLILALCLAGAAACTPRENPFLTEGDRLMVAGDTETAIAQYREALATGPNVAARRALALAYQKQGQAELAAKSFEAALDGAPNDPASLFGLSRTRLELGNIVAARSLLATLLKTEPTHSLGLNLLTLYSVEKAALQHAVSRLSATIQAAPKRTSRAVYEVLADSLLRLGQVDKATKQQELAEFAVAPPPDEALLVAQAALATGRNALALRLAAKLPERQASRQSAQLLRAEIYLNLGDLTRSRAALASLDRQNTTPEKRLIQARLQLALGFQTSAIKQLQEVLADSEVDGAPTAATVRSQLAVALTRAGHFSQAKNSLTPLLRDPRWRVAGHLGLAQIALAQFKWQEGLAALKALQLEHASPEHHHLVFYRLRGQLLLGTGDWAEAEKSFLRALALMPFEPIASLGLAQTLRGNEKPEAAIRILEHSLQQFAENDAAIGLWADLLEETIGISRTWKALLAFGEKHSRSAAVATSLGQWHRWRNEPRRALTAFRRANSLDATIVPAFRGLCLAYLKAKRSDLAEQAAEASPLEETGNPALAIATAQIFSFLNRPKRAQEILEKALEKLPNHPRLQAELALLWAPLSGHLTEAQNLVHSAAEEAPGDTAVLSAKGIVAHFAGQNEKALQQLNESVNSTGTQARSVYFQGVIFRQMGQKKAAQKAFLLARSLDPLLAEGSDIPRRLHSR